MASIRKRPGRPKNDPRYEVRYRDALGDEHSRTFTRKTDAETFADNVETDIDRGDWADPRLGRELVEDYAKRWMASKPQLRPRTRDEYQAVIDRFVTPKFGNAPLARVTTEQIRTWHADIAVTSGPARAAKAYRVLRSMMNTAVDDGLIARNPCRVRGAGEEQAKERPFLSAEQVRTIAAAMPEDLRLLALLGAACSLRLGELLALRRRSIDLLRGTLTVTEQCQELAKRGDREASVIFGPPKTEAGRRRVAIPPTMLAEVEDHLARHTRPDGDALLFAAPRGGPLPRKAVYRAWSAARKAADVPGVRLHDLRHFGATMAAQSGATTKEIMVRLGHASPRAALIYQHAAEARDQAIAEHIGAALAVEPRQDAPVSTLRSV